MDNATLAMLIKTILSLLGVFAAVLLVKYRLTISKIIDLIIAVKNLTDETSTEDEVKAVKKAWVELKNVLRNYTGMKKYFN